MPQPTLVTALLNIGRSRTHIRFRRSWKSYTSSLQRLAQLNLPMHIYAESEMHAQILKWRRGKPTVLHSLNAAMLRETDGFARIQALRQSANWLAQADWLPYSPMADLELYIPLVMSKLHWLAQAAEHGTSDDQYIWIDAGIHMHLWPGEHRIINEDYFTSLVRKSDKVRLFAKPYESNNEVHGFERSALAQFCNTDFVDRCCKGGVFGGSAAAIKLLAGCFNTTLMQTLSSQQLGTEESILTILSYRHPELTDVSLLPNTSVASLFNPHKPLLNLRRLRHPRSSMNSLKQKSLRWWKQVLRPNKAADILSQSQVAYVAKDNFDLHILLCARDLINGIWTLRSFFHFSGLTPRLIIHDDGSLTNAHQQTLYQQFPQAQFIPYAQAHYDMTQRLADRPNCYRYRISEYSWPAIKLLDFAYYSNNRPFMVLDADVLFFKRPQEILQAIERNNGFFMSDWQDAYTWPQYRWPAVLGTTGIPRVNVGLFYLPDGRLYDLDYIEQCLAAYYQRQPCPRAIWLEQTIWAALFSRLGKRMQRLPDTYQISNKQTLGPETCSHHYVNDRQLSRLDFVGKGIPYLIRHGFLKTNAGAI